MLGQSGFHAFKGWFDKDHKNEIGDIAIMKRNLVETGDMRLAPYSGEAPLKRGGLDDLLSGAVIRGLMRFQSRNGLKPDGVMGPDGPTERAMRSELASRPTPPRIAALQSGVGESEANAPRDVAALARGLAVIGALPVSTAAEATRLARHDFANQAQNTDQMGNGNAGTALSKLFDISSLLRLFQRDYGLTEDGVALPGGETEAKLNRIAGPLILSAQRAADARASLDGMRRFYPARVGDLRDGLNKAGFLHGHRLFPMFDQSVEPETALEQFQFEENLVQDNSALEGGPSISRLQLLLTDPNFPALQLAAGDAALKAEGQTQQQNAAQNTAQPRRAQNTDLTAAEIPDEHAENETYWRDPTGWVIGEAQNYEAAISSGVQYINDTVTTTVNQASDIAEDIAKNITGAISETVDDVTNTIKTAAGAVSHGILRVGADAGQAIGLEHAGRNLHHFLDGSGEPITLTYEELQERGFITSAAETNRERFEEELTIKRTEKDVAAGKINYLSALENLKDGETIQLPVSVAKSGDPSKSADYFDRDGSTKEQILNFRFDEALAYGSSKFRTQTQDGMTAKRIGDTIIVEGTFQQNWTDDYDFHPNGLESSYSDSDLAISAQESGFAKDYKLNGTWQERGIIIYKITDDGIEKEKSLWHRTHD